MVLNILNPEDRGDGGLVTMILNIPPAKKYSFEGSLLTMVMNIYFVEIRMASVKTLETSFSMMNRGIFVGLSSVSMRFLFHVGAFLIKTHTSS
jgi:hypothetical protein